MRTVHVEAEAWLGDLIDHHKSSKRWAVYDRDGIGDVTANGTRSIAKAERLIMEDYIQNWVDGPFGNDQTYANRIQFQAPDYFSPSYTDLLALKCLANPPAAPEAKYINHVRKFMQAYGSSRFGPDGSDETARIVNLAGWTKGTGEDLLYLIPSDVWKSEICATICEHDWDFKRVGRALAEAGMLERGRDGLARTERIASLGKSVRVYALNQTINKCVYENPLCQADKRPLAPKDAWVDAQKISGLFDALTKRCGLCGLIGDTSQFYRAATKFVREEYVGQFWVWLFGNEEADNELYAHLPKNDKVFEPVCNFCHLSFEAFSRNLHNKIKSPMFDNEAEYVAALHDLTRRKRFKERLRKYADTPLNFNPLKAGATA
jgi:hypothetical protein